MTFDCLKGKCQECGEEKFVFIPHGDSGIEGVCIDCLKKLQNEKCQ